jgi:spore coat polysaccharide biosynthesis protein SpsF (cytidylyltransferase family)
MVVYKNEFPYQDRMGTSTFGMSYRMQTYIFNKMWEYSIFGSGTNVTKTDWLLDSWAKSPEMDITIDTAMRAEPDPTFYWGYKIEEWQHYEIDYQEDLEMCRVMMEAFILKGRGIDVYKEAYNARV